MPTQSAEYDHYQGFVERRITPNVREFLQNMCTDTREMVRVIANREDIPEDAFAQYSEEMRKKIFEDIMRLSADVHDFDNLYAAYNRYDEDHEATVSYESYTLSPALESFLGEMHMIPIEGLKRIYWNTNKILRRIPQYIPQEELQRAVTEEILDIEYSMYQNKKPANFHKKEEVYQNLRNVIPTLDSYNFRPSWRAKIHEGLVEFGPITYELERLLKPFSLTRDQLVDLLLYIASDENREWSSKAMVVLDYISACTHAYSYARMMDMLLQFSLHWVRHLKYEDEDLEFIREDNRIKVNMEKEWNLVSAGCQESDIDIFQYQFSERLQHF